MVESENIQGSASTQFPGIVEESQTELIVVTPSNYGVRYLKICDKLKQVHYL